MTSRDFEVETARELMAELIREASAELNDQGYKSDLLVSCRLELRYLGQNYELELDVEPTLSSNDGHDLWEAFHNAHRERFGFSIAGETIEVVTFSTTVSARTRNPTLQPLKVATKDPVERSRRSVGFIEDRHDTPIYWRGDLLAGHVIRGPAVVEEPASITIVLPSQKLFVDSFGHLVLTPIKG